MPQVTQPHKNAKPWKAGTLARAWRNQRKSYMNLHGYTLMALLSLGCSLSSTRKDVPQLGGVYHSTLPGIQDSISFDDLGSVVDPEGRSWKVLCAGVNHCDTLGYFRLDSSGLFYKHPHWFRYDATHPAHYAQPMLPHAPSSIVELYGAALLTGRHTFTVTRHEFAPFRNEWMFTVIDSLSTPKIHGYSINSFLMDDSLNLRQIDMRLNNIIVPFR